MQKTWYGLKMEEKNGMKNVSSSDLDFLTVVHMIDIICMVIAGNPGIKGFKYNVGEGGPHI